MKLILYCCGPLSADKDFFCKKFIEENDTFGLIELHKIRKKITGSIVPIDANAEIALKEEAQKKCKNLLRRKKHILVNGLFLNSQARKIFFEKFKNTNNTYYKKVAIIFNDKNITSVFQNNQSDKLLKDVSFDLLRSQSSGFKQIDSKEEADLIIFEVAQEENSFKINTKLWGEDRIISCDNFKKLLDFITHAESF